MNTTKSKSAAPAKTVKVTLAKPHTHSGQDYPAGAELEVDEVTAQWLQDQQVIAAPTAEATKA